MTKSGTGTLLVAGPYTVSGQTAVTGGILELQSPTNTFPVGPVINNGGTLQVDSTASVTIPATSIGTIPPVAPSTVTTQSTGNLHVAGGTLVATGTITLGAVSDSGGGAVITIDPHSNATFTTINYNSSNDGGLITVLGGNMTVGTLNVNRSGATSGKLVDLSKGVIVNDTDSLALASPSPAIVNIGNVTLATNNSYSSLSLISGTVNVSGPFLDSALTSGGTGPVRGGVLQVTGGTLTSTDPNGLQMARVSGGQRCRRQLPRRHRFSLAEINMFPQGAPPAGGSFSATVTLGGTSTNSTDGLYLGAGGIQANVTGGSTPSVILNGGTLVLGATANWTAAASVPFALNGPGSSIVQAADSLGNPFNITIAGPITGPGAITKTGGGTLTLSGATTNFLSNTEVNQGTLALDVTGSIQSVGVDVNPNAAFEFLAQTAGTGPLARNVPLGINLNGGNLVMALAPAPQSLNRSVLLAAPSGNNALTINSGTVDLSNNDMIYQNGGESGYGTINGLVAQGRGANGLWTGAGASGPYISSSAAATTATTSAKNTALAVVINDTNQTPAGSLSGTPLVASASPFNNGLTSFDGQPVNDGDVLVKYTYYGDALLTGSVIAADYTQIDNAFVIDKTTPGALTGWYNGDFNYDGKVNGDDYTLIDNAFNTQGAVSFAGISAGPANMIATNTDQIAGASSSAVPEPGTLGLLGIAAFGLIGRRKRRGQ